MNNLKCVVVVMSCLFLTACSNGGGSTSSGGGSNRTVVEDMVIVGDREFREKIAAAFRSLPSVWRKLIKEYTKGVKQAPKTFTLRGDRVIRISLDELWSNEYWWISGVICHESAHHKQSEIGTTGRLSELERESQARSWQHGCLVATGAPQSALARVERFGVAHLSRS